MYTQPNLSSRYRKFIYKFSMWPVIVALAIVINVLLFVAFTHFAPESQGATITMPVTIVDDIMDEFDGECSLREAVLLGNFVTTTGFGCVGSAPVLNPADTLVIQLQPGLTYPISLGIGADEDFNVTGDLDITTSTIDWRIEVAGAGRATLAGTPGERILDIFSDSTITFSGVNFLSGVTGDRGGAIRSFGNGTLEIIDGEFRDNTAAVAGGAIAQLADGTLSLTNASFVDNESFGDGGAVFVTSTLGGAFSAVSSTFQANTSTGHGAGVFTQAPTTISNSLFTANISLSNAGAALLGGTGINSSITNTTFDGNSAVDGGALFVDNGHILTVTDSFFANNVASGAISGRGGAAFVATNASVSFVRGSLTLNTSDTGGAIFADAFSAVDTNGTTLTANTAAFGDGGAAFAGTSASVTFVSSTVSNNHAGEGGAAYTNGGFISVFNSEFHTNTTTDAGGAFFVLGGSLFVEASHIHDNIADPLSLGANGNGGVFFLQGDGSTVTIASSTLNNNQATDGGGAGYVTDNGALTLDNSTVSNNIASNGGGFVFDRGSAAIRHATIAFNQGSNGAGISSLNPDLDVNDVSVEASLIISNTDPTLLSINNCVADPLRPIISNGSNLEQHDLVLGATCGFAQPTDIATDQAANTIMDIALVNEGGVGPTHALVPTSPAVNGVFVSPLAVDQRGLLRPAGTTADIGAYEFYPFVSVGDASVTETDVGTTAMVFPLTLSSSVGEDTVVTYSLIDVTANGGADYVPVTNGTSTVSSSTLSGSITVLVNGDVDQEGNELFQLVLSDATHAVIGDGTADGTIIDNDLSDVNVSDGALSISEGASDTYTIVLVTEPTDDVTITLAVGSPEVFLTTSTYTFNSVNFATPQIVTVTAFDDFLVDGTTSTTITHTVVSADPNYDNATVLPVEVTVLDNDAAGVTASSTPVIVTEGAAAVPFTLVLDAEPLADVTVSLVEGADYTLDVTSVFFTTTTWNVPQQVFVTAVDDADVEVSPEILGIPLSSVSVDPAFHNLVLTDVPLQVNDNDSAGVSVSPTLLTPTEGETQSYGVVLNAVPTDPVNIILSASSNDVLLGTTTLVFTPADFDTEQFVSVTAIDNDIADGGRVATVNAIVVSGDLAYDGAFVSPVTVNISDNDTAGVTVSSTAQTIAEGGADATYTLVLSSEPTADVSITIGPDNADFTVLPTNITFTTSTWNIPQLITASAIDDAEQEGQEVHLIAHSALSADPNYNGAVITPFTLTIDDNDSAAVSINPTSLAITEGDTDSFSIVLTTEPSADVAVSLGLDSAEATLSTNLLTFNNVNWDTPQSVDVTAIDDAIAEGIQTVTVTSTVVSADGNYNGATTTDVIVTITDNDTVGVTVTPTDVSVTEGGAGQAYSLVLDSMPTDPVTISLSSVSTDFSLSTTTVTFLPGSFGVPQFITVTAVDDVEFEGVETAFIAHVVSSIDANYNGLPVSNVTVTVNDNDVAGISVAPTSLSIVEGTADQYALVLNTEPFNDVTITLSAALGDIDLPETTFVFSPTDWFIPQLVTVNATDDNTDDGDQTVTISHSVSSLDLAYHLMPISDVTITATDNDTAGVSVAGGPLTLTEGESGTYTLVLDAAPQDTVTVTIGGVTPDVTLSATTVTFTSTTFNVPQTITVTTVDDNDTESAEVINLTHTVTSGDLLFDGLAVDPLTVTINDNDLAGITITPTTLTVGEGTTTTYTVVLTNQPALPVTVTLFSGSSEVAFSPSVLTFGTSTFNVPQPVTVLGVDDPVEEGTDTATITHGVASADPNYDLLPAPNVTVTITDNDAVALITSVTSPLTLNEGDDVTYSAVLGSRPTGDVVVTLVNNGNDIVASPKILIFTTSTFGIPQFITLVAEDDTVPEGVKVTTLDYDLASTDSRYDILNVPGLSINVIDNDAAAPTGGGGGGGGTGGGGGGGALPPEIFRPATGGTVVINGGADTTDSRFVSLELDAPRAALMAISDTPDFAGVSFQPFAPQINWELPDGSGLKSVFVRFRNELGTITETFDTITLSGPAATLPEPTFRQRRPRGVVGGSFGDLNDPLDDVVGTISEDDPFDLDLLFGGFGGPVDGSCPFETGTAVKTTGSASVYYITSDCERRPFYSNATYFCFFDDWNGVQTVDADVLNTLPEGPFMQCEQLAFDLFIVNPDGSRVYSSDEKKANTQVDGHGVGQYQFDDSGEDYDMNDVVATISQKECDVFTVTLDRVDATWRHQVYLRMTAHKESEDRLLWRNSHLAVAQSIDIAVPEYLPSCK